MPVDIAGATRVAFVRTVGSSDGIVLQDPVFWKGEAAGPPLQLVPNVLVSDQLFSGPNSGFLLLEFETDICCPYSVILPVVDGQVHYMKTHEEMATFPLEAVRNELKR
ncbi:MAG: hypothetical protein PHR35_16030 [Kiritimatiellae bacterium]|nr:hypothetical protein [Kiritimatiellia bacterium]